jgi:hypothetical protein
MSLPIVPKCPACNRAGGAINAKTHCPSQQCSWNICVCGTTYDRKRGSGFGQNPKPVHYPAKGKP